MANPYGAISEIDFYAEREAAVERRAALSKVPLMGRIVSQLDNIIATIDAGDASGAMSAINRFYDHQDNVERRTARRDLIGGAILGSIAIGGALGVLPGQGAAAAAAPAVSTSEAVAAGGAMDMGVGLEGVMSYTSPMSTAAKSGLAGIASDFTSTIGSTAKASLMQQTLDALGLSPKSPTGPTTTQRPTGSGGNPMDMIYNLFGSGGESASGGGSFGGFSSSGASGGNAGIPGLPFIFLALAAVFGFMFLLRR